MNTRITGLALVVITGLMLTACGASADLGSGSGAQGARPSTGSAKEGSETPGPDEPEASGETTPELSVSQQQAIESAQSYIDSGAFSQKGLIKQLKFEGFSTKEATYAAKNIGADYKAEALESAQSYLDSGSFSQTGLVKQLVFEGFPKADAVAAVNASGGDWNAEAVEAAQSYLDTGSFSRSSLISQLKFEGFTTAQATAAVKQAGL